MSDKLKCGFCGKEREAVAVFESQKSDSSICVRCVLVCNSLIIKSIDDKYEEEIKKDGKGASGKASQEASKNTTKHDGDGKG